MAHAGCSNRTAPAPSPDWIPDLGWDPNQRQSLAAGYRAWRLDIAPQVALKRQAIHCYRSQTTDLIHDDPTGFRLSPELMAHFLNPWEIYFEYSP